MREILFRGKRKDNGKWAYGYLYIRNDGQYEISFYSKYFDSERFTYDVIPETVGQYIGLTDKNGKKIFEGDIVQYSTYDYFVCKSIVKFGAYKQDGSSGEHDSVDCLGFYVEVGKFTCPDWFCNEPENFQDYLRQQNLAEIASQCEIIGNIHDSPELLEA